MPLLPKRHGARRLLAARAVGVPLAALLLVVLGAAPLLTAQREPDSEKALIAEFERSFKQRDSNSRAQAVSDFSERSRGLEDGGSSKRVARALVKALEVEDLQVQAAGVLALSYGRHVDTVIDAWGDLMQDVATKMEARITRPDEESRAYVTGATRVFRDACAAIARYRDDRVVALLSQRMRVLQRNTSSNNMSTLVVRSLADALLDLGTHDAVQIVIKQTQTYTGGTYQRTPTRLLHESLAAFANRVGRAPPPYSEQMDIAWGNWFREYEQLFPDELGKLKVPPEEPEYVNRVVRRRRARDAESGPERP